MIFALRKSIAEQRENQIAATTSGFGNMIFARRKSVTKQRSLLHDSLSLVITSEAETNHVITCSY